jgi:outer membrane receptor protein involved in Fe transport
MRLSYRYTPTALVLLATLAGAPPAPAQQRDTLQNVPVEALVVTAKRYPALRAELPQRVDVVSRADIERTPALELADVLKKNAAVDVIQYPTLLSGIGIRGFRPEFSGINKRVLLLIDGRPAGASNLSTIDLNSLERIEVLKGPASSLYGSSAMGGAINLVTRRSAGPLGGSASASYGSWQTGEIAARLGGSLGARWDTDVAFGRFRRGADFRAGEGNVLRGLVGSEQAVKLFGDTLRQPVAERGDGEVRPNTQYGYGSGSARLGVRLGAGVRADARGEIFFADDVQTPGDIFVESDLGGRKNLGRRTGELALAAGWGAYAPLLRVFAAEEEQEFLDTAVEAPFVNFTGENRTRGMQLQNVAQWGGHTLTGGVDLTAASASSRRFAEGGVQIGTFSPDSEIRSTAAFAEAKLGGPGDRLSATLGGRLDRVELELRPTPFRPDVVAAEERFTVFNPSAGLQYALGGGVRVHGTAGRAFVAPDAFTRAGLSQSVSAAGVATITVGNVALSPERSRAYDLGVGFNRPALGLDADVTLFRTRVEDRITRVRAAFPVAGRPRTADGNAVGSVTTYVNATEAEMEGAEARLGYDLGTVFMGGTRSLRLFANATRIWTAREIATSATVDAARFAGRTDFRAEEVTGAFVFGAPVPAPIRNVADLAVGGGVEWDDLRRWSVRLSGRYVGERIDTDFTDFANVSDVEYPPFMTLDWVAGVRFNDRFRVELLVDNLTDENYYEKRGFNLPGRTLRMKLSAGL